MKTMLVVLAIIVGCGVKTKNCYYDVYQHGIKIDTIVRRSLVCESEHGFTGVYYKNITRETGDK